MGATTAQYEKEQLKLENKLLEAKTKALESAEHVEELYKEAIDAMRTYGGYGGDTHDD